VRLPGKPQVVLGVIFDDEQDSIFSLEEGNMETPKTWKILSLLSALAILVLAAGLISIGTWSAHAQTAHLSLSPGAGAPEASGMIDLRFTGIVLQGVAQGKDLPAQPFGSGRFYGVWFVRTDTGSKAFLGALIAGNSIILSGGGEGTMQFAATHFTTGPDAGSPITFGSAGTNRVVVLIENNINGLTPSPVGPIPGTGLALVGTF
jgi:hypothetical protein